MTTKMYLMQQYPRQWVYPEKTQPSKLIEYIQEASTGGAPLHDIFHCHTGIEHVYAGK